jgi:osmotically-inducible protein OsmY
VSLQTVPNTDVPLTDLDIHEAVANAINDLDFVRESDLKLHVNVISGEATISGVVLSRIMHRAVVQAAASAPGVRRVIDNLMTDTDIEMAVGQALSKELDLVMTAEISAMSYRGTLILAGKAPGAEALQRATEIAAKVPGVVQVVNRLTVPGDSSGA